MNYVSQLAAPLYDMGALLPRVAARAVQTVRQPAYPLYAAGDFYDSGLSGLAAGPVGPQLLSIGAGIVGKMGPIGAGIGLLMSVVAGLWAKHAARVAGAKSENAAINSAVQTWDAGMQAIFAAANSSDPTQNVTAADAANQVQQLFGTFWQMQSQYMHAPGTSDTSNAGTHCGSGTLNPTDPCAGTPGGHQCDKSCTASCCVGCQDLYPSMLQALQVFASPTGGSVKVCAIAGSKYGAQQRSGYTLTYTPPTVSSMASGAVSSLESLFGGTGGTGSSSMLPILAIGVAAFLLLR